MINNKKMKGGNRKMTKKQLGILMLGVLVIAFLSFAIASSKTVPFINANECTADELCEVKNLLVKQGGSAVIPILQSENGLVRILSDVIFYKKRLIFQGDNFTETNLDATGLAMNSGMKILYLAADRLQLQTGYFTEVFISTDEAKFNFLADPAGNSTAYVCADAEGKLFRSKTPCV